MRVIHPLKSLLRFEKPTMIPELQAIPDLDVDVERRVTQASKAFGAL